ncbi:hypothetical protein [Spiroplasma endosymbiont of Eupeodes luniger]
MICVANQLASDGAGITQWILPPSTSYGRKLISLFLNRSGDFLVRSNST